MDLPRDERGVSELIGFILIFGVIVIAFATYQATLVPAQNQDVEYKAYENVRADLIQLQNNIVASAASGAEIGTNVRLGASYPSRIVAMNPPPPTGSLRTGDPRTVSFSNISAIGTEPTNTRAFWNGSRSYADATSGLEYRPNFNEIDAQAIGVTGESVYVPGETGLARLEDLSLVAGNRIRLQFIQGDLNEQGLETSINVAPRSTIGRTIKVTGDGGPLTLTLDPPPLVSTDAWISGYGSRLVDDNDRVLSVSNASGQIQIKLNGSRTYNLQLAEVAIDNQELDTEDADPAYVITADGNDQVVTVGQRAELVAEVRDRFNNPVTQADVEFSVIEGSGQFLDDEGELLNSGVNRTIATDSMGRASVKVVPTSGEDDLKIRAEIQSGSPEIPRTNFSVQVSEQTASIGSGAFYTSFSRASADGPGDDLQGATFRFKNVDEEESLTVTDVTVDRVSTTDDRISSSNADPPWDWVLSIYSLTDDGNRDQREGGYDPPNRVDIGETMTLGGSNGKGEVTLSPQQRVKFFLYDFQPANQNLNGEFMEVTIDFTRAGESFSVTRTLILF